MRLTGMTAIITGSSNGIGRAAAELFAREGAKLTLVDIDPAGEEVAAQLRQQGCAATFIQTDVSVSQQVKAAVAATVSAYGGLHIVYNNAGGSLSDDGIVVDCEEETFWKTFGVNTFGTWLFCKFGIPEIIRSGGGSIINTSSMTALRGIPQRDAYVSSKGAVDSLTRSMAIKFGPQGIRVNSIAPGIVLTERGRGHLAAGRLPQAMIDRHVVGPLSPSQVAYAALFLASDEASGITGQTLPVDAGYTIG